MLFIYIKNFKFSKNKNLSNLITSFMDKSMFGDDIYDLSYSIYFYFIDKQNRKKASSYKNVNKVKFFVFMKKIVNYGFLFYMSSIFLCFFPEKNYDTYVGIYFTINLFSVPFLIYRNYQRTLKNNEMYRSLNHGAAIISNVAIYSDYDSKDIIQPKSMVYCKEADNCQKAYDKSFRSIIINHLINFFIIAFSCEIGGSFLLDWSAFEVIYFFLIPLILIFLLSKRIEHYENKIANSIVFDVTLNDSSLNYKESQIDANVNRVFSAEKIKFNIDFSIALSEENSYLFSLENTSVSFMKDFILCKALVYNKATKQLFEIERPFYQTGETHADCMLLGSNYVTIERNLAND